MRIPKTVTIRDLRHHGGRILDDVAHGESVLVTRDGTPIAELPPTFGARDESPPPGPSML